MTEAKDTRELMVCDQAHLGFYTRSEPVEFGLHLNFKSGCTGTGHTFSMEEAEDVMRRAGAVFAEDLVGKMFWVDWPHGRFSLHGDVRLAEDYLVKRRD